MIRHILTIIWNERKANSWIVIEYTFVFCILWFCCDYLYFIGKSYMEPLGFNIEHTYRIQMKERDGDRDARKQEDTYAHIRLFLERVKRHPAIEGVSISQSAAPYLGSFSSTGFKINTDSVWPTIQQRMVTPDFFDVFKIKLQSGRAFNEQEDWNSIVALIAPNRHQRFGARGEPGIPVTEVRTVSKDYEEGKQFHSVIGITAPIKTTFYDPYRCCVFLPMNLTYSDLRWAEIIVRVRPKADRNFVEQFTRDMREQLMIGPYFLTTVTPLTKLRDSFMKGQGITSSLNSIYSITAFLIINIFLGIIGTFWYRTQARRSEIGLRIAMGASRRQIETMLFAETLLLLFIASVIGLNICLNINQTDLLQALGIPQSDHAQAGIGIEHYFINYTLTFGFLAIISLAAVWYPARQAASIPPVEALQEE